jgi:hypothetical protein
MRFGCVPLRVAVLLSPAIALFDHLLQILANRIGDRVPSASASPLRVVRARVHRAGGGLPLIVRRPVFGGRRRSLEPGGKATASGTRKARAMASAVATVGSARPFFT